MRNDFASYIFPGVFAPTLSLDELASQVDTETGVATFDIPDTSLSADIELERSQAFEAVSQFVQTLPPRDRAIVRRVFWEGATQTQVATDLGVSKMAISKAMARVMVRGRHALAVHEHLAFTN